MNQPPVSAAPPLSRLRRKLHSGGGFTLMELLMTLLIVAMLGVAVAAGITAGVRVYRQSIFVSESATLNATLNTALSDVLRYATDVTVQPDPAAPTFNNSNYSMNNGTLLLDENGYLVYTQEPLPDPLPEDEDVGLMLVNRGAYTKLHLTAFSLTYDPATCVFRGSYTIAWFGNDAFSTNASFTFRSIAAVPAP